MNNLNNELNKIGQDLVTALLQGLSNQGLGNSDLANSIKYKITNNVLILDMYEYGEAVDKGTKPHMPPVSAIEPWAKAHGVNAWGVAINIKKYGTQAQPFIYSIDSIVNGMEKRLTDAGFKDFVNKTDSIMELYFKK